MKRVVNSAQMKAIDNYTIEHINIPSMVLMERAALHVADQVRKHIDRNSKILAVCGFGNNGGDGIAVARILTLEGYAVDILTVGDEEKATQQTKEQLKIARNLGISIDNNIDMSEYTIIIDAIFGIGLSKPVMGTYETIINTINAGDYLVFSVDIPSGLSADNAKPNYIAVKADYTITFGWMKQGLLLYPGYEYAGEVIVADIGFPNMALDTVQTNYFTYDSSDLKRIPERKTHSNKGTYGKVLIIAGSTDICGACFFSAKAAYRTGAGLVKIVTASENRLILQSLLPEAIVTTYNSNQELNNEIIDKIVNEIKWASVIVFGPGIGVNTYSDKLLDILIDHAKVPVIIDADGINLLARRVNKSNSPSNNNTNESIEKLSNILPDETILTPHLLELSRLINIPIETIQEDLFLIADQCTTNNKLIFVIKDEKTIVTNQNKGYINTSGNNGMATGGTGDVLTGVIAGLIAQGLNQFEASTLGVFIHGLAGDMAAKVKGTYGLMASDVIEALPECCYQNAPEIENLK